MHPSLLFLWSEAASPPLAMIHGQMQGVLPTGEALSSLGVQGLYWALSDRHGGLPHNWGY